MPQTAIAPKQTTEAPAGDAPALLVPFTSVAREATETFHDRTSNALSSSSQHVGPDPVIARGYAKGIWLFVELSGGAGGSAVAQEDAPFSVFQSVSLTDVSGAELVNLSGFGVFLADKYGGYQHMGDARRSPSFTDLDADGNGQFVIYLPIEASPRSAFGALVNQHGQQRYQLSYTIDSKDKVFSTDPATTLPTVRVRAALDYWTQPAATDLFGRPAQQTPDFHGTRQFWTRRILDVESGDQTIQLSRVGNHIRQLIFVYRDDSTPRVRTTTELPEDLRLEYDGNPIDVLPRDVLRHRMASRFGLDGSDDAAAGMDTGVLVWDWCHDLDGKPGWETRSGYLPTTQGTDLTLRGTFGGSGGKLEVITNDLIIAGQAAA